MKKVALIGSTGSIGRQVIDVVRAHSDKFRIVCMAAGSSYGEFERQINLVKPEYAALSNVSAGAKVREIPAGTAFSSGEEAALVCADYPSASVVVIAASGFAGLKYSLRAVKSKKCVALANKETLVCGGDVIMPQLTAPLIPVDSEHSAIWQCLNFNRGAKFKNLILTASGGPFKDRKFEELGSVTPEQALNHPTWKMGAKITVDSATLLNKGYEVIEAHHLYNAPYQSIKTVIQPQSIIHSMVELEDGAVIAQMSNPTMELPIQLALTYPERYNCNLTPLDFSKAFSISFTPLERKKYPLYDLALECGEAGGVMPTVLNAASEVAVNAFLKGGLSFTGIYGIAKRVADSFAPVGADGYAVLEDTDRAAREAAAKLIMR